MRARGATVNGGCRPHSCMGRLPLLLLLLLLLLPIRFLDCCCCSGRQVCGAHTHTQKHRYTQTLPCPVGVPSWIRPFAISFSSSISTPASTNTQRAHATAPSAKHTGSGPLVRLRRLGRVCLSRGGGGLQQGAREMIKSDDRNSSTTTKGGER